MGAMSAYGISYLTEGIAGPAISPWLGVLTAGVAGMMLGSIHGWLSQQPRVNDVAVGIAMIIFGGGLANFLGKPFIQPQAPQLPTINVGGWSSLPQVQSALQISPLFLLGVAVVPLMSWFFKSTRWGLYVRAVGDSPESARAMGISIFNALVIFARWQPWQCLWASLLFGGAQALGPAFQSVGIDSYYYLFNAAPYILTLLIMIMTCSPKRTLIGAPGALGKEG